MTRGRFFTACLVLLLLATAVNTFLIVRFSNNLKHDEHTTCIIQARGLRAQAPLVHVMADLALLLTPTPGAEAKLPPRDRVPFEGLRRELGRYVTITSHQPKVRRCASG